MFAQLGSRDMCMNKLYGLSGQPTALRLVRPLCLKNSEKLAACNGALCHIASYELTEQLLARAGLVVHQLVPSSALSVQRPNKLQS
eukprot:2327397-Amphidinium_carterae.1